MHVHLVLFWCNFMCKLVACGSVCSGAPVQIFSVHQIFTPSEKSDARSRSRDTEGVLWLWPG